MTTAHRLCPSCTGWIDLPAADAAHLELQRVRQHQAEAYAAVAAALGLLDEELARRSWRRGPCCG